MAVGRKCRSHLILICATCHSELNRKPASLQSSIPKVRAAFPRALLFVSCIMAPFTSKPLGEAHPSQTSSRLFRFLRGCTIPNGWRHRAYNRSRLHVATATFHHGHFPPRPLSATYLPSWSLSPTSSKPQGKERWDPLLRRVQWRSLG